MLRDPLVLVVKVKVKEQRAALDSSRVAAQSEIGAIQCQLAKVRNQRERFLQLYLDDQLAKSAYTAKATELRTKTRC